VAPPPGLVPPASGSVAVSAPGGPSPMADASCIRHLRVRDGPGRAQRAKRGDHIAADETRTNERIRAREVLLIAEDGEQLGVKPLPEALQTARERDLDLVEVAPNANPPVCRIMDFNRHQYEEQQRRKESRRKATQVVIKEMKFRPKIDSHDYTTKMRHVERFLAEGNKVKLTIMFRGREMAHPELGLRILERIADEVSKIAIVESAPRQDGRNMTMVLHPIAKGGRRPKGSGGSGGGRAKPSAPTEPTETTEDGATPETVAAATEESGAA
jgi:translation initiation factor IF-3